LNDGTRDAGRIYAGRKVWIMTLETKHGEQLLSKGFHEGIKT